MKIRTKLALLLFFISVGIIAAAGIFSTISLDDYFRSRIISELRTQNDQFEYILRTFPNFEPNTYFHLQQLAKSANLRLTLIDENGVVVFESELPPSNLSHVENHLHRPEIQEAITLGIGTNIRKSATINIEMLYLAKALKVPIPKESGFPQTKFLRVGIPLTHVQEVMGNIRDKILITSVLVLTFVIVISLLVSRKFSFPISAIAKIAEEIRSGKLDKRIPITSKDEIGELAETLNGMVDKLNEDIMQLKKLERVRSEFLGNVSHELRTPIFAMQGMLETLLGGALDDKEVSRDFVERTLKNTERLNTLLGDLIEISRIESGEMKMSFHKFPINDLLTQIISELQPLTQQKNISLTFQPPPFPLQVLGDEDQLKQVLINLIENAIKYTLNNGNITIVCSQLDGKVKIMVKDNGIGISQEHIPRIFERFYRVDKERSRDSGGTGLGLAIVKHIVEAHGSHVEVRSEVGRGSEFSFVLKG